MKTTFGFKVRGSLPLVFVQRYLHGWYRPNLPLPANRRYARVTIVVEAL